MAKGSLLHFDVEFTHPVPGVGAVMEIGGVFQPMVVGDDNKHGRGIMPLSDRGQSEFRYLFPVDKDAIVTQWVRDNQSDLLAECGALERTWADCRQSVLGAIHRAKVDYGDLVIPCGWCLGSDIAYLYHILGHYHDEVSYEALDISAMILQKFGDDIGTAGVEEELGVKLNADMHNPLADAKWQMAIFNKLLNTAGL